MTDLDRIISRNYQFKLNGEVINVNQPTVKMVKEFNAKMSDVDGDTDIFDAQVDFVYTILNNNTSAKKFSKSEVEKLPMSVLSAVIDTVAEGIQEAEDHPN